MVREMFPLQAQGKTLAKELQMVYSRDFMRGDCLGGR
jgi:hypothetical protein